MQRQKLVRCGVAIGKEMPYNATNPFRKPQDARRRSFENGVTQSKNMAVLSMLSNLLLFVPRKDIYQDKPFGLCPWRCQPTDDPLTSRV